MVQSAPRYDDRIFDALRALDDRNEPVAELWRRVGKAAELLGLPRPSYVHLRRLVRAERERQDAIREITADVVEGLVVGRRVNAYEVADRVREARDRSWRY